MQSKHFYEFGGFNFYPDTHALVRLRDEHPFSLTPKVSILLALLIKRSGNLVKYGELRENVWPESPSVHVHTIHQTKNALSSALGDGAGIIETINGQGYRLNASVTERFNEEFSSNGAGQKNVAALPGAYQPASTEAPPSLQCHDVEECAPLLPAVSAMRWVFTDHYAHVIIRSPYAVCRVEAQDIVLFALSKPQNLVSPRKVTYQLYSLRAPVLCGTVGGSRLPI